jgi:uncharacterized protein YjbI with pentapeptide repeats
MKILDTFLFFALIVVMNTVSAGKWEDLQTFRKTGECNNCDLSNFTLTGVIEELKKNGKSINLDGSNLENVSLERADLKGAILGCTCLNGADLSEANLEDADLHDTDLTDTLFCGARMKNVNLGGAIGKDTEFTYAQLRNATFDRSTFTHPKFRFANLSGASFYMATINGKNEALKDAFYGTSCIKDDEEIRLRENAQRLQDKEIEVKGNIFLNE